MLESWYDRQAFVNSIWLATAVSVAGLPDVTPSQTRPMPWLKAGAVTTLPLISPPFTSSIALTLSLGPNGILLKLLGIGNFNFYGFWGTWMSETLTYFPVSFLTLAAVLTAIDPNLEDAGLSLGASPGRVFRTVTLPLSVPGIANSFLLLFASSLADFATPLVLAGHSFPVLPTQAYLQITACTISAGRRFLPVAAARHGGLLLQRFWVGRKNCHHLGKTGSRRLQEQQKFA